MVYPEHLSRGLVLVKWWLLAIPHYIVVGVFIGGSSYAASQAAQPLLFSGGLVGILVLVAAVILTFTGTYPTPLFDLVIGLQRWVVRVAGYAALMTDVYPPFRLDLGGDITPGSVTNGPPTGDRGPYAARTPASTLTP